MKGTFHGCPMLEVRATGRGGEEDEGGGEDHWKSMDNKICKLPISFIKGRPLLPLQIFHAWYVNVSEEVKQPVIA